MYTLRPYQEDAIARILDAINRGKSPLVVMATGLGKTVVFTHLAEHFAYQGQNVLILAHRAELVGQAYQKMASMIGGHRVGIEMAQSRQEALAGGGRVIIASKDSMKGKRLRKWPADYFGLIVADESHHATAQGWRDIMDHFPHAKRVGVTATPDRTDGTPLGMIFDEICYEFNLLEAIEAGWLVPIRQHRITVDGLDLSSLKANRKGDFSDDELESLLNTDEVVLQIVKPALEIAQKRPTLFFAPGVKMAAHIAQVVNSIIPDACEYIASYRFDKDTGAKIGFEPELRDAEIKKFLKGERLFLSSCGVFLEGFDAPNTAVIVMARPTNSRMLYAQALGRGTRPLAGVVDGVAEATARRLAIKQSAKPHCDVLDFVGNSGRHALVHAEDVLFGSVDPDYLDDIRKVLEERQGGDIIDTAQSVRDRLQKLADAAAERAEKAAQETADFFAQVPRLEEVRRQVNPLVGVHYSSQFVPNGLTKTHRHDRGTDVYDGRIPPTRAQVEYLVRLGVPEDEACGYHRKQAGAVIDSLTSRRNEGPPSPKMAWAIKQAGYDVPETWGEAKALLDQIKK